MERVSAEEIFRGESEAVKRRAASLMDRLLARGYSVLFGVDHYEGDVTCYLWNAEHATPDLIWERYHPPENPEVPWESLQSPEAAEKEALRTPMKHSAVEAMSQAAKSVGMVLPWEPARTRSIEEGELAHSSVAHVLEVAAAIAFRGSMPESEERPHAIRVLEQRLERFLGALTAYVEAHYPVVLHAVVQDEEDALLLFEEERVWRRRWNRYVVRVPRSVLTGDAYATEEYFRALPEAPFDMDRTYEHLSRPQDMEPFLRSLRTASV